MGWDLPMKIVELLPEKRAIAEMQQQRHEISLSWLAEPVHVGDWVMVHTGFSYEAMGIVDEEFALSLLSSLSAQSLERFMRPHE